MAKNGTAKRTKAPAVGATVSYRTVWVTPHGQPRDTTMTGKVLEIVEGWGGEVYVRVQTGPLVNEPRLVRLENVEVRG